MSACSFFPWSPDCQLPSHWMTSSFPASLCGPFIFNVHLLLLILLVELRPSMRARQQIKAAACGRGTKGPMHHHGRCEEETCPPARIIPRGPRQNLSTDRCFSAHCTWHCFNKKNLATARAWEGSASRNSFSSPCASLNTHLARWRLFPGHDASSIHRNVVAAR